MKNFRRLLVAVLLTAVFAMPAWAGDISSPGAPAPGDGHSPGLAAQEPGGAPAPGDVHSPVLSALGDISTPGFAAILLALWI